VNALQRAALAAEAEAESLRTEAQHAITLETTSDLLYDIATDAINAYSRARERAKTIRLLADHHGGGYNAWSESA
jgi:hypothetical protein